MSAMVRRTGLYRFDFRACITAASCRAGAKIADCVIVTTTAIALTALSLMSVATGSATDLHGAGGHPGHSTASFSRKWDESAGRPVRSPIRHGVNKVADTSASQAPDVLLPGRDKCKRRRGLRTLPLWCTDRGAGWIGST